MVACEDGDDGSEDSRKYVEGHLEGGSDGETKRFVKALTTKVGF